MSLKAFHIFFILAAIFLSGWLALSELRHFNHTGARASFYVAVTFGVTAVSLVVYFIWFVRKLKNRI